jgi:hypothetical protein
MIWKEGIIRYGNIQLKLKKQIILILGLWSGSVANFIINGTESLVDNENQRVTEITGQLLSSVS